MRRVTVDADAGFCDVRSVGVESVPGLDTKGLSVYEYLYRLNLPGAAEPLLRTAARDYDAFLQMAEGFLPTDKLQKHKILGQIACRRLMRMKLSFAAKFGKSWKTLSPEEKRSAKTTPLMEPIFEILRHIFPGNAPYTPDTVEYKALISAVWRIDRIVQKHHIEKIERIIPPGSSLVEIARSFLYNDRTGDDDAIRFSLV